MRAAALMVEFAILTSLPCLAQADNFIEAHYDARTDELVVTLRYRGTNPDHQFNVQWGTCQPATANPRLMQLAASVLDNQFEDVARTPFKKQVRFSLADIPCRPADVTLRTAPRFYYRVSIPASPR